MATHPSAGSGTRPYSFQPFPSARYRRAADGTLESRVVRSEEESTALGPDWTDSPHVPTTAEAKAEVKAAKAEAKADAKADAADFAALDAAFKADVKAEADAEAKAARKK